jgi:hypothetical protein
MAACVCCDELRWREVFQAGSASGCFAWSGDDFCVVWGQLCVATVEGLNSGTFLALSSFNPYLGVSSHITGRIEHSERH